MSTIELPKLPCCTPTAYDGASTTLVHAYYCEKSKGRPLGVDEWASLRKLIEKPEIPERTASIARHPSKYKERKVRLVHCRCSSPVMPCPLHRDNEDWWSE